MKKFLLCSALIITQLQCVKLTYKALISQNNSGHTPLVASLLTKYQNESFNNISADVQSYINAMSSYPDSFNIQDQSGNTALIWAIQLYNHAEENIKLQMELTYEQLRTQMQNNDSDKMQLTSAQKNTVKQEAIIAQKEIENLAIQITQKMDLKGLQLKDIHGHTALQQAQQNGMTQLVKVIKSRIKLLSTTK